MEKRTALLIGGGVVLVVGGYLIYRHEKNAGISGSGSAGTYSGLPVVTTTFDDGATSSGLPILYGAAPAGSSGATSGGGGGGVGTQPTRPSAAPSPSAQPSAGGHAGKLAATGSGAGSAGGLAGKGGGKFSVLPTPNSASAAPYQPYQPPPPNPALETGPTASGGYTPSAVEQSYPTAPTTFPFTTIFTGSNGTVYYGLGNENAVNQAVAAGYTITNAQAAGVPGGTTKAKYAYKS